MVNPLSSKITLFINDLNSKRLFYFSRRVEPKIPRVFSSKDMGLINLWGID